MKMFARRNWIIVFAVGMLAAMAVAGYCTSFAPALFDSFDGSGLGGGFTIGPSSWAGSQAHDSLGGNQTNHIRTPGMYSARDWSSYRDAWNSQSIVSNPYSGNVYLKCWLFEDNDCPYPIPVVTLGHTDEEWPNAVICLTNTNSPGTDSFILGAMGNQGYATRPTYNKSYFDDFGVYTTTNGAKALDGTQAAGMPVAARRQGWRQLTIVVNGFTGTGSAAGDVQFFVDSKLVFNGKRAAGPMGQVPLDTIILGGQAWTQENVWYDQCELDSTTFDNGVLTTSFQSPQGCATIQDAKNQPDGTWVSLDPKTVTGNFTSSTLSWSQTAGGQYVNRVVTQSTVGAAWPGYITIEDDDQAQAGTSAIPGAQGLWVSTSYQAAVSASANTGERVQIKGRMRTNYAGMRYLDAFQITQSATGVSAPVVKATSLANLSSPALDGRLVKVWGQVGVSSSNHQPTGYTVAGQERSGDWRRFIWIDDGSGSGPVKCYIDNILTGTNPTPSVSAGDFVTIVGVVGKDVLVPANFSQTGTDGSNNPIYAPATAAEKSIWIRGTGDLVIIRHPYQAP